VVHVSQLKLHVPPNTEVMNSLDMALANHDVPVLPLQVLVVQDNLIGGKLQQKLLVQWEGQHPSWASWEDAVDMKRRYSTAWGQACRVEMTGQRGVNSPF
jgi:hypothetical protein